MDDDRSNASRYLCPTLSDLIFTLGNDDGDQNSSRTRHPRVVLQFRSIEQSMAPFNQDFIKCYIFLSFLYFSAKKMGKFQVLTIFVELKKKVGSTDGVGTHYVGSARIDMDVLCDEKADIFWRTSLTIYMAASGNARSWGDYITPLLRWHFFVERFSQLVTKSKWIISTTSLAEQYILVGWTVQDVTCYINKKNPFTTSLSLTAINNSVPIYS